MFCYIHIEEMNRFAKEIKDLTSMTGGTNWQQFIAGFSALHPSGAMSNILKALKEQLRRLFVLEPSLKSVSFIPARCHCTSFVNVCHCPERRRLLPGDGEQRLGDPIQVSFCNL